jgi:hypothetical protein
MASAERAIQFQSHADPSSGRQGIDFDEGYVWN